MGVHRQGRSLLAIEPRESLEIIDIHARSLAAARGRGAYCPWARV